MKFVKQSLNIIGMLLVADKQQKTEELYLLEDLASQVDQANQDHPTIKTHVREVIRGIQIFVLFWFKS